MTTIGRLNNQTQINYHIIVNQNKQALYLTWCCAKKNCITILTKHVNQKQNEKATIAVEKKKKDFKLTFY